ncbi:hypothetical protein ES703_113141 [subsurface metagenome]
MDCPAGRKPKDRDFIKTREDLFFCVTGYLHPPGGYTAYLKYRPSPKGRWKGQDGRYERELKYYHVGEVAETLEYLRRFYPRYISFCPIRGIEFSLVHRSDVNRYYLPEERLAEIIKGPRDALEEAAARLVYELSCISGVKSGNMGITGSVLLGIHNPRFSDIDLLIFGLENACKIRAAIKAGVSERIRPEDSATIKKRSAFLTRRFPLNRKEALYIAERRWYCAAFGRKSFSIHPTRTDEEIRETYGDRVYREKGTARVRAVISDARESLFTPAVYRIYEVKVLEGAADAEELLTEIVSFEGLYRDLADRGTEVEARGILESVGDRYYRLVIGSTRLMGAGYLKRLL